jgi:hypothetical protein
MRPDQDYAKDDPLAQVVNFLEKVNRDQLASDVIDVFAKYSTNIEQINLIAKLYLDIRNTVKAEEYALKVLKLAAGPEGMYNARANLAKMYNIINEPGKSLFHSKINAAIAPDDPDTKLEMVFSLYLLARNTEAEAILREMKSQEHMLSTRHVDIVDFNLGTYDMQAGNFLKGLGGFLLNGKKLDLWFGPTELPYAFWNGGIYPGKTLILFMEGGGIGDEFITIRWMPVLKNLGFNPVYYTTRSEIYDIFTRCGYDCIKNFDNIPKDALWTYAMQVPLWLQVKPEQVLKERYLHPSEEARAKWAWVKGNKKIRIGVRWQGNAKNERDLHRRVPVDQIMPALKSALQGRDVEYYSLQIGDGAEETAKYPELIDVSDQIESYDDTFALLENLDFVVSSCTSVLHAAAIMGTQTLALIPISAYFTWLSPPIEGRPENTSIWYGDNLRMFKQTESKNWTTPLTELTDYLIKQIDNK